MTTLFPGQSLYPGQSLQSNNQMHRFIMQSDGNVVLYNGNSQPLWATNTWGIQPRELIMQTDGNLVLYDSSGSPKWASDTWNNPGAFFKIQDDGNLVVYRADSQTETVDNALWASGSNDIWDSSRQGTQNAQIQEILAAHNRYRAEVGVPPLQWSENLAVSAQQWANHLADTGTLQHSRSGENLAQGSTGFFSVTQLVDMWGDEKQYFSNAAFPNVSNTGNWMDVAHYTQVMWRNTTEVGCGLASGNGNDVLVCHYNPVGNITDQGVF
ncbi:MULTISPECIES: CAP domain-containing protein [unclassified Tolypothrix]|uniref:CAP domain-containing protein n=1 Tax=unclassified Tolypothrix TaxID=2649714 RepID=UPI0005EAB56A|nr:MULTISPECIES: CAP domain-containing protein [unclassified Tolypothrix]EKF03340.1 SCP-like extracellular protein [Tolypothrix sp. PCC 7601]BAY93818.1 SCP-like extracellular [Microchaete diplosiphon NIES-3275]